MLTLQAVLTLAFNIVCIGYTTLMAANFVCGLAEEWLRIHNQIPQEEKEEEVLAIVPYVEDGELIDAVHTTVEVIAEFDIIEGEVVELPVIDATLTIRQLKALASAAHIKGYGRMTKAQLIEALNQ